MQVDLDPCWEWIDVQACDDPGPRYIRGQCKHLELEPVTSVTGQQAAPLCRTCDAQLPTSYAS